MTTPKKVSELAALVVPAAEDLLLIVDDPSVDPTSKKITLGNLTRDITSNNITTNNEIVLTQLSVGNTGSNASLTSSVFRIGGSSVNTAISSTSIRIGNSTVNTVISSNSIIIAGGGFLGQVYGDGFDTELTIKSPPGVGNSGYVALASTNEKNYVEVSNIGIALGVEFGTAGFKKLEFDNTGNLSAPGTISATNVNATTSFGLPVYATNAARDSAIPSPQPGMMVFVSSGEGAGLQVRGATQWNPVGGLTGV